MSKIYLYLNLAFLFVEALNTVKAAVTCYGTSPADLFDVRSITRQTAVQGHLGGKDTICGFSDPAAADVLEFNLEENALKTAEIFRYPDQGHAFLNGTDRSAQKRNELRFVNKDTDPKSAALKVRDLVWPRISAFFINNLGGDTKVD
ncbi:hypothetical protein BJV82DRAFT_670819 [Fennellomyces sp. T-0311]|nr:hypothetical protein BJV82DRAFT_670819 [Fennellomyces sp. T-0311]